MTWAFFICFLVPLLARRLSALHSLLSALSARAFLAASRPQASTVSSSSSSWQLLVVVVVHALLCAASSSKPQSGPLPVSLCEIASAQLRVRISDICGSDACDMLPSGKISMRLSCRTGTGPWVSPSSKLASLEGSGDGCLGRS